MDTLPRSDLRADLTRNRQVFKVTHQGRDAHGSRDQEALSVITAELLENVQLGFGLHAFGRNRTAQILGHADDCRNDGAAAVLFVDAANEAAVDLDRTERVVAKPGQGGVSGADVI